MSSVIISPLSPTPPQVYQIDSNNGLQLYDPSQIRELVADPRGVIWIWEPPQPQEAYCVSADPTKGIPGWTRELRHKEDSRTDNAAVCVLRKGKNGGPDVQVAEYAAPIDPFDLAPIINVLGRMYGSSQDDGQALVIIEVYPGPGYPTQRELLERFGYTNLFVWKYLDRIGLQPTMSLGWNSTPKSVRDLWILGTRHIKLRKFIPRSPWLVEEMADCVNDPVRQRGEAIGGKHDDRVVAALLSLWALNEWTGQVENIPTEEVRPHQQPEWQASGVSYSKMMEQWEQRVSDLLD